MSTRKRFTPLFTPTATPLTDASLEALTEALMRQDSDSFYEEDYDDDIYRLIEDSKGG